MRPYAILLVIAASCITSSSIAPEVIFYYQIEIINPDPAANIIRQELEQSFPLRKYAITNSSGNTKPFYQEFDLSYDLDTDSLMPPHTFVHKMQPFSGAIIPETDSRLLKIHLFPEKEPSYSMEIYLWENSSWNFLAQTGIHPINSEESEYQELTEKFRESIIQFSFK
jgi:hypothetical protein